LENTALTMDNLILDSLNVLKEGNNIQYIYSWMDIGDLLCQKQRLNEPLKEHEFNVINNLTIMLKRVIIQENIVLYRGLTKEFDPSTAEKQFNALSPNLDTAETYGEYLIKVFVPKGSNAFYVSAWELINTNIEEQEEKEVLLFPGKFTLHEIDVIVIHTYITNFKKLIIYCIGVPILI